MEIPPVTIKFHTAEAQTALQLLAEAALESPEIVQGIAKLETPLFDSMVRDDDLQVIVVSLSPSERLRQFLRGLGKYPRPKL